MTPTIRTAAAVALALAASLAVPTTAQAAPAACESGTLVAPVPATTPIYADVITDATFAAPAQIGVLAAAEPLCATGRFEPSTDPTIYPGGGVEVILPNGGAGWVTETSTVTYPVIDPSTITWSYAASRASQATNLLAAAAASRPHIFNTPAAGAQAPAPVMELEPGDVFQTTSSVQVEGISKLGKVQYQPVLLADGASVGWIAADTVEALPAADTPLGKFTIPSAGYLLFDDPTDPEPVKELPEGTNVQASAPAGGWMRSSNGWIKAPEKTDEAMQALREKAAGVWDSTKATASDLKDAAADQFAESKDSVKAAAEKSRTLTFPAMVLTVVLSALAMILTTAGLLLKPARGLSRFTPRGVLRSVAAYAGVPIAIVLGLVATTTAPAAWAWSPWLAAGAVIFAAVSMTAVGSRVRGGELHADLSDVVPALRSPVVIGVGVAVLIATVGSSVFVGGNWVAYVVAVVAAASTTFGAALMTGRAASDAAELTPTAEPTPTL